jgi:hypothetical protein
VVIYNGKHMDLKITTYKVVFQTVVGGNSNTYYRYLCVANY